MNITKQKTITELRSTLFETFEQVVAGEPQLITHKSGKKIAMVPSESIQKRDYPVVQACILLISTTYVVINTLTDIASAMLDPRIRLSDV